MTWCSVPGVSNLGCLGMIKPLSHLHSSVKSIQKQCPPNHAICQAGIGKGWDKPNGAAAILDLRRASRLLWVNVKKSYKHYNDYKDLWSKVLSYGISILI